MKKVLVYSLENAGRSQMAEAWLKYYGKNNIEVISAGDKPSPVSPLARKAMSEAVLDIAKYQSKSMEEFTDVSFDFVICFDRMAYDMCPGFKGDPEKILYEVADPTQEQGDDMERLRVYRAVCDAVEDYCFVFTQKYLTE